MCGVFILIDPRQQVCREQIIPRVSNVLQHRGPDADASLAFESATLVFRRLSIVDEAGGMQPLTNEDQTLKLICNGEIYNYRELRAALEAQGHQFRTNSDCEVILHLYEQDPVNYVSQLSGMFAFILLDTKRRIVHAARDRIGIKPLVYHAGAGIFAAASEVKALFAAGIAPRELDPQAVRDSLVLNFPPGEQTIFRGIRSLPPGALLELDLADPVPHERRYWSLQFPARQPGIPAFAPSIQALHDVLTSSVQTHLIGDRPVAAYLSGGIDSTITSLLLRDHFTDRSLLKTFSIAFPGQECDEAPVFKRTVGALGLTNFVHESQGCNAEAFRSALYYLEQPQSSPMDVPMGELSGLVRRSGVKVVLSGEGSDELLGGYPSFKLNQIRRALDLVPRFKPFFLPRIFRYYLGRSPQAEAFIREYASDYRPVTEIFGTVPPWYPFWKERDQRMASLFSQSLPSSLGPDSAMAALAAPLKGELAGIDDFNKSLFIEMRGRLPNYILQRTDRNSMRNSVEARVPYLSNEMLDLSRDMPPMVKMFGIKEKHALRKAFEKQVPAHVLARMKFGYQAPLSYLWDGADPLRDEVLSDTRLTEVGLFKPEAVRALRAQASASQEADERSALLGALTAVLSVQLIHDSLLRSAA